MNLKNRKPRKFPRLNIIGLILIVITLCVTSCVICGAGQYFGAI